jgi:hypothetical protein
MQLGTSRALLGLVAAALTAAPALAHHSYAMFDMQKNVTLEGTVTDYQWTNPHGWIEMTTTDAAGKQVD